MFKVERFGPLKYKNNKRFKQKAVEKLLDQTFLEQKLLEQTWL
jgi:hypothetical protein